MNRPLKMLFVCFVATISIDLVLAKALADDSIVFPEQYRPVALTQTTQILESDDAQVQPQASNKALEKCREYSRYYEDSKKFPCGHKQTDLLNGEMFARAFVFPHMASMTFGNKTLCAGVLISDQFVITVAHCVNQRYNDDPLSSVRLGDLNVNISDDEADPQEFAVQEVFTHPKWVYQLKYNDIALVKLEKKVTFNEYIFPACLNTAKDLENSLAVVTGWGQLQFLSERTSEWMKKVKLNITTYDQCSAEYKNSISRTLMNGISKETHICAAVIHSNQDTCQGDSGAPLQQYTTESETYCMYNIIGLTSFGKACGIEGVSSVFTKVDAFIPWIESIVWP